ncbi:translocation/assembly module TamB domain-containing protein [Borrelia sp. RT5S]|uniref:translocation/assembly module TamB domain-containing protein n=1 Tax=Borrelia sp. RT5S TaxID=2898581 RepID=UPI001E4A02E2|nr:translocation/assembly module TamB domain-containing protein [Borrelia sp. RT5S]UGQ16442.1 translocation/assembly module TamB [Borrelia sp. RT5S]
MNLFFVRSRVPLTFFCSVLAFISILVVFVLFIQVQVYSARYLVIGYLESKTGFKIKYERIAPYFFSSIKIDNLELSLNDQEKVLMSTVKINLDLFKLLLGDKNIILNIFVQGSTLNFDLNDLNLLQSLSSSSDKFELGDDKFNNHAIIGKMSDYLDKLHINLEDISINLKLGPGNLLEFKVKNFGLKTIDDDFLFSSIVDFSSSADFKKDVSNKNSLDSTFYFEGKFKKGLEDGYVNVSFLEFNAGYFSLLEQGFQINYSKGNLEVFNLRRENLDFNLSYDVNKNFLRLDALFFDINLLNWIRLNEDFNVYKDYFDIALNGQLAFSYDFQDEDLRYSFLLNSSSKDSTINKEIQGIRVQLKGNNKIAKIQNVFLKLKRGFINYKGYYSLEDLLPIGRLDFRSARVLNFRDINGYLDFSKENRNFLVKSDNFKIGRLEVQNLSFKTSFSEDKTYVNYLLNFKNNKSMVLLKGDFDKENFRFNLGIKEFPLLFLNDVLPESVVTKFIPEHLLSGKYFNLTSDFYLNTLSYDKSRLNGLNFSIASKLDDFNLMFDASGEKGVYKIRNFTYKSGDYSINSVFLIHLLDDRLRLTTDFSYLNKSYPLYLEFNFKDKNVNLEFSSKAKANLNYANSMITYSLNIDDFRFHNKNFDVLLNINSYGNYEKINDDLSFVINKFRLDKISNNPAYNLNFSFKGLYKNKEINLSNIRFVNKYSNLQGQGYFNLSNKLGGEINLFSNVSTERYFLGINSNEDGNYVLGRFQGLDFDNFKFLSFLNGKANGNFILNFKENDLFNYSLNAYLETDGMSLIGIPTYFSFKLGLVDNNLNIYNIKAMQDKREILAGSFRYDIKNSIGVSNLNIDSDLFSSRIDASFQKFENKEKEDLGILKRETEGEVSFRDLRYKDNNLSNLTIEFRDNPEKFSALSIEYDLINVLYEYADGNFNIKIGDYLPLSFDASGKILKNEINGIIQDIKFNSELITKDFLNSEALFNIEEHFVLHDIKLGGELSIDGDLYNPNLNGEINILSGSISTEYLKSSRQHGKSRILELVNVPVLIQDNKLILDNSFNLGYYSDLNVSASLNLNFLSDTIVDYYKVDIDVPSDSGVPIKFDKVTINFIGYASGNFFIEGNAEEIVFSGDLNIANSWVYLLENSIFDFLMNPFKRKKGSKTEDINSEDFAIVTDLKINFDSNVAFHWPDNKISFLNVTVAKGNELIIKSDTRTDDFILKGDLNIASGSVNYNNKKFVFKGGSYISFNENKAKFDPWVRIEATNTIKDGSEKLLVTMGMDGPLSLWDFRFVSYPVRTEQEIKYLLSSSIIGSEHGLRSAGTNTAEIAIGLANDILVDLVVQPIEDYARSVLKLDLLSIKTDILRNVIGISGNPTFASFLDNTSVEVGKYFSNGVFGKAGFGFLKEQTTPFSQNLNFNVNFGIELDSPFFFVDYVFDYDLTKNGLHGIGNNISISWKFKY